MNKKYLYACTCGQVIEADIDNYIRLQLNQKFVCDDCKTEEQTVVSKLKTGFIVENNDF